MKGAVSPHEGHLSLRKKGEYCLCIRPPGAPAAGTLRGGGGLFAGGSRPFPGGPAGGGDFLHLGHAASGGSGDSPPVSQSAGGLLCGGFGAALCRAFPEPKYCRVFRLAGQRRAGGGIHCGADGAGGEGLFPGAGPLPAKQTGCGQGGGELSGHV